MDRTLNPVKRGNRRCRARNWKAWQLFSPDGDRCRFCPHSAADHLTSSGQPHFYRPATEHEKLNPHDKLYRHDLPNGGSITVKRVVVSKQAELITNADTATARYNQMNQEQRKPAPRTVRCNAHFIESDQNGNCGYCGGKPGTSPVWNRED